MAQTVDLTLISPDEFPSPYGLYRSDFPQDLAYNVEIFPCRFPLGMRTSTRWMLVSRDLGFRSSPPDIIHVENEAHSFSVLQALVYRRLYAPRARVVVFVWANQRLSGVRGLVLNKLARLIRPGIDCYIAGNKDAKTLLVESGVPDERVTVFPMVGADVDYYTPASPEERTFLRQEMGIAPDEFVIGYVGRLVEDKGIPDLMLAFRGLREQVNGARARVLCVGEGPLKAELMALQPEVLVASPGVGGAVLPYYRAMDVLVLPSRTMLHWKEQFGRALVEAMATGVAVIGSDSGAIPEVIGNAGLVFPEKDVARLVHALKEVAYGEGVRMTLATEGLKRVRAHYSDLAIASQTSAAYRQIGADLNRSAPPS